MKNIFIIGWLFVLPSILFAQVGINTSGSSPDNSAMLDVQSTSKGMLIPRMTTAQRTVISSPATGLLVFDNTTTSFWFYNGSVWEDLSASIGDKIADADNDTKIQVEESLNEDVIRFDANGQEIMTIKNDAISLKKYSEVVGNTRNNLTIRNTDNALEAGLAFRNGGSSYSWSMFREPVSGNVGQASLVFSGGASANDPVSLTERLRISNTGNVGINTANPTTRLEVNGTVKATSFVGDGSGLTGITGDNLGNHFASQNLNLNGHYLSGDGDDEGVFIDDSGKVGIGTEILTHTLNIEGTNSILNDTTIKVANLALVARNPNTGLRKGVGIGFSVGSDEKKVGAAIVHQTIPNSNYSLGALHFATKSSLSNNLPIRMTIDWDGKVGIGTTSPTSLLDVDGNITAKNITCNGIITADSLVGDGSAITNVGSVKATENIRLNGHFISGGALGLDHGLYVNSVGNVGIGTSTVEATLHIVDFDPIIRLKSSLDHNSRIEFFEGNNTRKGSISHSAIDNILSINRGTNIGAPGGIHLIDGGNIGIGTKTPETKFEVNGHVTATKVGIGAQLIDFNDENLFVVRGKASGSNSSVGNYLTVFKNNNIVAGNNDVETGILALQFTRDLNGHSGEGNWIEFFENSTDLAGKIENNNNGNVQYQSGGSDYAELLERLDHAEVLKAGEIVGIYGGKISKNTQGADWVMGITDQAVVVGNAIYNGDEEYYETVSFIGQIPVYVKGKVELGDYIISSGDNDGIGIAVSPQDLKAEQGNMIIGRAWESKATGKVERVNTVVGLPESSSTSRALLRRIISQENEIDVMKNQINELISLKSEIAEIKQFLNQLNNMKDYTQEIIKSE